MSSVARPARAKPEGGLVWRHLTPLALGVAVETSVILLEVLSDIFMTIPVALLVLMLIGWGAWNTVRCAPPRPRWQYMLWVFCILVGMLPATLLGMALFEVKTTLSLGRYESRVLAAAGEMRRNGTTRKEFVRPCFGVFRMSVRLHGPNVEARLSLATAARVSIAYTSDGQLRSVPKSWRYTPIRERWYKEHVPNPS